MPEAAQVETPVTPIPAIPAEGAIAPANATEQAPVEGVTTPEAKPADAPRRPGQSRFDRKIDRLHRERAEAQAERDFYKRQVEEAKARETPKSGAPKVEDFSDIEAFRTATDKYAREEAVKEYQAQQQAEISKSAQAKMAQDWEAKTAKADAKYEDFDEVVGDLRPTTPWAMALMQADNGEDIAYYLGKHIKEAQAITVMDPISQIRAIGKLEAKLLAEPPKPKAATSAPAPITPVSGTGAGEKLSLKDGMSYEDFVKVRNKQLGRI